MKKFLIAWAIFLAGLAPTSHAQTPPTLDSLVVNPVIPSHNYITEGEYHNFKAYATSNSGGSLTYDWTVNGTTKSTSWTLHYSFPSWESSPYTIHLDICEGSACTSWEETYTAGSPPGGGGGGLPPIIDSLVVTPVIPSHNYITQGEYHNFKAYAHSATGGSLTYQWYVNGSPKTTAWQLHYSFPTWDTSPYTIRLEVYDGADSTSWQETYTAGTPPGGGNVANKLYYIHDHLGSVRVVIDDNGDVVHHADYYPFGMEMAGRTSTTERPKEGFTGHEKDEETGNYYGEARYYDPEIGVWYNIDPMASKYPNASPYNYVFGNPILLADPTGADPYWDARFEGDEFHNWATGSVAVTEGAGKGGSAGAEGGSDPCFHLGYSMAECFRFYKALGPSVANHLRAIGMDTYRLTTIPGMIEAVEQVIEFVTLISTPEGRSSISEGLMGQLEDAVIKVFAGPEEAAEVLGPIYAELIVAVGGTKGASAVMSSAKHGRRAATVAQQAAGGQGFQSFSAFKRAMGPAGNGQAWHHIVEQGGTNVAKFGANRIHNTSNLIRLPHGKGSIHAKISGYYSSKQPFTGGQTVRQWLGTQSYQQQYDFGIRTLKQFGWTP